MKRFRELIRATLIGGIIFLLPLVFVVVVIGKAFQIMKTVAAPLGRLIPFESVAGLAVVEILTVLIMILSCLLAGLVARSPAGKRIHEKLDTVLLQVIPGYAWVKGMTGAIRDEDAEKIFKPVLVEFDDQFQLGYEVDRTADELVAVYLPGAPDPRSGNVSYVTGERVKPIDAGFQTVSRISKHLGRGSSAIAVRTST